MDDRLLYTVVITSLLIAVIIVFFVVSVIRYHQRYILMQKERIHAEIMIQEQERKRIANDLHDSLGPLLSTVKLYIHSLNVEGDEDQELLDKASLHIDETIGSLREIAYNLLPSSLSRNGLFNAVHEYIYRITARHPLKISFNVSADIQLLSKHEIHLFRIIQEVIHNSVKHAQASLLTITMTRQTNDLMMVTEDNGIGFDIDNVRKLSTGLGLKSIQSRCEIINASMQIITAKNKGCTIIINIPNT